VSDQEQLDWEARLGRPAAVAAFAAGVLQLAGTVLLQSLVEDRPRIETLPDFLLSVAESSGTLIAQAGIQVLAVLCLIPVFYYLFRATVHRVPEMPRVIVYLIFIGPVMYAIAQVLGSIDRVDLAEMFADRDYRFENPDEARLENCPEIQGQLGEDCAEELVVTEQSALVSGLSLAGGLAVALTFILVSLRSRRAGLLSPLMGILGVAVGALLILQILQILPVGPSLIEVFWLIALGGLLLGRWPGGRGPAWESGKPDPWLSPAQRRGIAAPPEAEGRAGNGVPPEPDPEREPEPVPKRPSSRKRKRKRR
jgi:drug/metabolite transporter (DMT)-like permease